MLGISEAEGRIREPVAVPGDALLSVTGLSRQGALHDVSFSTSQAVRSLACGGCSDLGVPSCCGR